MDEPKRYTIPGHTVYSLAPHSYGGLYKRDEAIAYFGRKETAALEAQAEEHDRLLRLQRVQVNDYAREVVRLKSQHAKELAEFKLKLELREGEVAILEAQLGKGEGEPVLRPALLRFALEMERKLKANDHHKSGWEENDNGDLLTRVLDEARELRYEIESRDPLPERVIEEAADLANFAMMIADNAGLRPCATEALGKGEPALVHFEHPRLIGEPCMIHRDYRPTMEKLAQHANDCGVSLWVTSPYRRLHQDIEGAIVKAARRSNHYAGSAVDLNVMCRKNLFNSRELLEAFDSGEPEHYVRSFLDNVHDDPGLRWGGTFNTPDPVHFDDDLVSRDPDEWAKRVRELNG